MGYLGSSLDDYYSFELLEKVIEQVETGSTGNREKLMDRLNRLSRLLHGGKPNYMECAQEIIESEFIRNNDVNIEKLVSILKKYFS